MSCTFQECHAGGARRHPIEPSRRKFIQLGAAALLSPLGSALGAQTFPSRPVRIVVGFATGGPNDISARLLAQCCQSDLSSSSSLKTGLVPAAISRPKRSFTHRRTATRCSLFRHLLRSTRLSITTYLSTSSATLRRSRELCACRKSWSSILQCRPRPLMSSSRTSKANPGKINMATAGIGTVPHVAGELFKYMTGVNLVTVGYRGGGPALVDLLGGQVQMMFEPTFSTLPHIKAGKLRALAVTSAKRSNALPDVPALNEFVPGYKARRGLESARPGMYRARSSTSSITR